MAIAAQSAKPPDDAGDSAAPVPAAKYDKGYVPYREEKLAFWRELNDEVGAVKGHVGIFGGGGHAGHGSALVQTP